MSFDNIIGNNENKKILINTLKSGNILHSYLFYGKDGIGKKLFAIEFAKMILCNNIQNGLACNECNSCLMFNSGNSPDYFFIEPDGSSIKINQIRNLMKTTMEKPVESSWKVYIINDADLMTKEAQNCILKTLEEPQEYVVLILIASNENNILTTVKSRCTKIYFNELTNTEIKKYVYDNLNVNIQDPEIIELCDGSIAKAMVIVQKQEILGKVRAFIDEISTMSKIECIKQAELLIENKEDIFLILEYMYIILYKKIKYYKNINGYMKAMNVVQNAIRKLYASDNFDMTIDYMLIKMWEEIHEKDNRG